MASANKKRIKPLVSVLPIEPKDIERFWPLMEFMVSEALAFSGKYADSKWFYDQLVKDVMQSWVMFGSDEQEENKVFGVCIGRIAELPNYAQYEIVIPIMARPGWEKVSKKWGWVKKHVQLEKWI
jgi:hypothetical protein